MCVCVCAFKTANYNEREIGDNVQGKGYATNLTHQVTKWYNDSSNNDSDLSESTVQTGDTVL